MGQFKDISEDVALILGKSRVIFAWASTSPIKRVSLVSAILGLIFLVQYAYLNSLLKTVDTNTKRYTRELNLIDKELRYKSALDAVVLCIEAKKDEPLHSDWYCKYAVEKYIWASKGWPQDRVNDVTVKLAYGAMKLDLSNYIRTIELERLINTPPPEELELLKLLSSKTVVALWSVSFFILSLGMSFILWKLSSQREKSSAEVSNDKCG